MPKIPRWLVPLTVIMTVIALLPPVIIALARNSHSTVPRINLIPDMDYQPKFLPQTENAMFLDGRAMRPAVEGTVPRGELREDDHYYRGRVNDAWATSIPIPVTREMMERGRQRYEIFCAPCHGQSGYGDGMVSRRADELAELGEASWVPPASFHDELVRGRADGHIFNTISYGVRNMPAYGPQIPVEDRWAIVAYVRALQRSQSGTLRDVPAEARADLNESGGAE